VRKVDKSSMGIRPSSSLVKKNSGTRALLNLSLRHLNISQQHNHQNSTTMRIQQPVWILHALAFQDKKKQGNKENTKTGQSSTIIKPTLQYDYNPRLDQYRLNKMMKETDFY
jgi:hypothetical protein